MQPYTGIQCTNGSIRNKRYFDCNENCGVFVALNNISLFDSHTVEPHGISNSLHAVTATEYLDVSTHRSRGSPSSDYLLKSLPHPLLEIGDRVVWISDYGPELGTVRWIGVLPDSKIKEYTIGVEFVSICSLNSLIAIVMQTYTFLK